VAHHSLLHGAEFLLLFWGQQLADLLHRSEMGQSQVSLFGGNGLQQWLHFGQIYWVSVQQLPHVKLLRGNIGSETNDLLGVIAHDGLGLCTLIIVESKLLCQVLKVTLHHIAAAHHTAVAHPATTHPAAHHALHVLHHVLHLLHHLLHLLHHGPWLIVLIVFLRVGRSGLSLGGHRAAWMMLFVLLLLLRYAYRRQDQSQHKS